METGQLKDFQEAYAWPMVAGQEKVLLDFSE
jgi:hypothetical protein